MAEGVSRSHFEGAMVLACQHALTTQVDMFDALIAHGAEPSSIYVSSPPYSEDASVMDALATRGIRVQKNSFSDIAEQPSAYRLGEFERARNAALETLVDRFAKQARVTSGPILVLDDGGLLLRALHRKHPDLLHRVRAVEQTTRGLTELSRIDVKCPVKNVAASLGKEEEAPFIAESVLSSLVELFAEASIKSFIDLPITLVGYGTVGSALAALCKSLGCRVTIVDKDETRRKQAAEQGFVTADTVQEGAKNARILLGATGHRSISRDELRHLPDGCLVASGSSAEIEIDTAFLAREDAQLSRRVAGDAFFEEYGLQVRPVDGVQTYFLGDRRILLARGGRPVNFNRGPERIRPEKIQQTMALMFRGAVEVMGLSSPGVVDLEREPQERMLARLREVWQALPPETFEIPQTRAKAAKLPALGPAAGFVSLFGAELDALGSKVYPPSSYDKNFWCRLYQNAAGNVVFVPQHGPSKTSVELPLQGEPFHVEFLGYAPYANPAAYSYALWVKDAHSKITCHVVRSGAAFGDAKCNAEIVASYPDAKLEGWETYNTDARVDGRPPAMHEYQRPKVLDLSNRTNDYGISKLLVLKTPNGLVELRSHKSLKPAATTLDADAWVRGRLFKSGAPPKVLRTDCGHTQELELPADVVGIEDVYSVNNHDVLLCRDAHNDWILVPVRWPIFDEDAWALQDFAILKPGANGVMRPIAPPDKLPTLGEIVRVPGALSPRHAMTQTPKGADARWQVQFHKDGTPDEDDFWETFDLAVGRRTKLSAQEQEADWQRRMANKLPATGVAAWDWQDK